jgi:hypothetical protein
MIDIETLGTNIRSPILSIGACEFTFDGSIEQTFHTKIDVSCYDNIKQSFEIDYATLKWWSKQSNFSNVLNGDITLHEALMSLKEWMSQFDKPKVWCQGMDFDFPILKHAHRVFKLPLPWEYYNQRDTRTVYEVAPGFKKTYQRSGVYHDALEDCKHQVGELSKAYKLIHGA